MPMFSPSQKAESEVLGSDRTPTTGKTQSMSEATAATFTFAPALIPTNNLGKQPRVVPIVITLDDEYHSDSRFRSETRILEVIT